MAIKRLDIVNLTKFYLILFQILFIMLSLDEGRKGVVLARSVIEEYVKNSTSFSSDLTGIFIEKQGTFVTLHTFPEYDLRGCIGIPLPIMPLKEAIIDAAKSVTRDPRFPPLAEENALMPQNRKILYPVLKSVEMALLLNKDFIKGCCCLRFL